MRNTNLIFFLLLITFSLSSRIQQVTNQKYFFHPRGSSKCMDIRNSDLNGDYIVYPCHQGANQSFSLKWNPEDQTYTIVSNFNNYVMSVQHNWDDDKRIAINYRDHTAEGLSGASVNHQRFCFEKASNGHYNLVAKHSKKCMTAQSDETLHNIWQMPCSDSTAFLIESPFGVKAVIPGAQDKCTFGAVPPAPVPAPAPIYVPVPAPAPIYVPVPAPAPIYVPVPAPASITSYFAFAPRVIIQTLPSNYFNGTWIVDGLLCNNGYVTLQVTITGFTAIVSQGNGCYAPGSILFVDTLPTKIDNATQIPVNFYLSPTNRQRVWLNPTGPNTFAIPKYNLVFYRKLC